MATPRGWRLLVAIFLVASAAAFVVGGVIERSESGVRGSRQAVEAPHSDSSKTAENAHIEHSTAGEISGINFESKPIIIAAVAVSALLAAAVAASRARFVLLVALLAGLFFAGLDLREVIHQINASTSNVVVAASLVLLLHLAVVGCAGFALRAGKTSS